MIIYSKPGSATFRKVHLPELGQDFWYQKPIILEAKTIPTSTAPAGVFRQVINQDVSAISRNYSVLMSKTKALNLLAMQADTNQTSYYVDTGTAVFDCVVIVDAVPVVSNKAQVKLTFQVMSQVS